MIALSVVVENFFPPSPSDVFVVLAAFLSHRGTMRPLSILAVAWLFGVAGAVLVYWSARRFGRRFFQGRIGRRLMTPGTIAAIEREYLRFGVIGIFLFRMLPAFRAVVAPFAGLIALRPAKALLPIAAACLVWYGALILLGHKLGENWEDILGLLGKLNKGMWIAALVVLGLFMLLLLRRRRTTQARLATLTPFDPSAPERPAELLEGLPQISAEELDAARRARRDQGE